MPSGFEGRGRFSRIIVSWEARCGDEWPALERCRRPVCAGSDALQGQWKVSDAHGSRKPAKLVPGGEVSHPAHLVSSRMTHPAQGRPSNTPALPKAAVALVVAVLSACTAPEEQKTPLALTPPADASAAAVVRKPLPDAQTPAPQIALAPQRREAPTPLPAIRVPPDLLYVCVTDVNGEVRQVGIEFVPKVHALCKRHPEMGPCQYERQACRRSGGRVFAASGEE